MALELSDFWTWRGRVGRTKYAALGIFLFLIKHNIDRIVAGSLFNKYFTFLDYWVFDDRIFKISRRSAELYATLVVLALPFIWVGVVLTIRRLRDAGWPLWLVPLFFVPFLNLVFFVILALVPSAPAGSRRRKYIPTLQEKISRVIPRSEFGSASLGIFVTVILALLFTLLSIYGMAHYGWGLFIGVPFFLGLNSVLIYGYHEPRPIGKCIFVAVLSILIVTTVIFFLAVEGFICLMMAGPLAITLAILGGITGYVLQKRDTVRPVSTFSAMLIFLPGLIVAEPSVVRQPPGFTVTTSVVINADRATVWKNVVSFSELPPPTERLFKTGVAYPIRAEINGRGVGAVRHCVFSTGAFVEPITVWDEPRLLKFDVLAQPRVMDEWSPYNVQPPHVENYLVSREGQFLLTELPDGRTLLEGTTVYQNRFWPAPYWRLWSDHIIHRIHLRVLNHIKNLSEENR